jgi:bisanhydrobacterioruberin hydratase
VIRYRKYLLYFLILMYLCGAIGFVLRPDFFMPFTPFTLLFTGVVFLVYQPLKNRGYGLWFALVALIGYLAEVIGVASGFVFGHYTYGASLGFKLMDVPLTISLNWALLTGAAIAVSASLVKKRWLIAALAAVMITAIDVLIEQVAPALDFWKFEGGMAGLHNYAGWLLVSFVASYAAAPSLKQGDSKISLLMLMLQIYFFGLIYMLNL